MRYNEPMTVQSLYPHIFAPNGEPPRLSQHPRVRVAQIVMDYLAHGWSPEEICRQYPHLAPAEVHSAMAYYYDHAQEINDEIQGEVEALADPATGSDQSPFVVRMKAEGRL